MIRGPGRLTTPLALLALVVGIGFTSLRDFEGGYEPSLARRLLGPASEVAAGWQWVRVRGALDDGRLDTAYSRAQFALDLHPGSTEGWSFLASQLAFDRASPYRQKNPTLRTRWTQAALDLLVRGQTVADHPERLALTRGLVLVNVGDLDGAIPWPGGTAGAWGEAQVAFEEACALNPHAAEPWSQRAANLCLRLADPRLESDVEVRLQSLREALAILEEGLGKVHDTGPLHFQRGALAGYFGESEDGVHWPGGRRALFEISVKAFSQSEAQDFPLALGAKLGAQEALDEAIAIEPESLPE